MQRGCRSLWPVGGLRGWEGSEAASQATLWLGASQEQGTGRMQGACCYANATGGSQGSSSKFKQLGKGSWGHWPQLKTSFLQDLSSLCLNFPA